MKKKKILKVTIKNTNNNSALAWLKFKLNTGQKMNPVNRKALIWGFELLKSGNRTHESLCNRDTYSSLQLYFVSFFRQKNIFLLIFLKIHLSLLSSTILHVEIVTVIVY